MTGLQDDVRVAVPAWLEARLYVAAAFAVTGALVDRLEPPPAFTPLEDGLLAWDGTWYRAIADNGYVDADDPAVPVVEESSTAKSSANGRKGMLGTERIFSPLELERESSKRGVSGL